jgi:hypothetical protein
MKYIQHSLFLTLLFLLTFSSAVEAKNVDSEKFAKYQLIVSAFKCNIASESIAKTYLYKGAEVGARQANQEMKTALALYEKNFKKLKGSINTPKIKNLLLFIDMSYTELNDVIKEPYSLDNAQIVLDLVATISEGSRHIAEIYKKEIGHNDPVNRAGLIPKVESIAKYYIAYQVGIKDENTKVQMKKAVDFCQRLIKVRVNYPKNTVKMNQIINKVDRLWGIVHTFYLDLDEGGLPFIVFKTTSELKDGLRAYAKEYKKLKQAELSQ